MLMPVSNRSILLSVSASCDKEKGTSLSNGRKVSTTPSQANWKSFFSAWQMARDLDLSSEVLGLV